MSVLLVPMLLPSTNRLLPMCSFSFTTLARRVRGSPSLTPSMPSSSSAATKSTSMRSSWNASKFTGDEPSTSFSTPPSSCATTHRLKTRRLKTRLEKRREFVCVGTFAFVKLANAAGEPRYIETVAASSNSTFRARGRRRRRRADPFIERHVDVPRHRVFIHRISRAQRVDIDDLCGDTARL